MRSIPDPGFAGDEGSVPEEVRDALTRYAEDPDGRHHQTLAVLQDARVLVPVVATLGQAGHDEQGRTTDKTSDMATVLMTGRDGRRALLAFTGAEPMARWDPRARPVPVSMADAARSAVQDGADALLLDVAGPVLFVLEAPELQGVAEGSRLMPLANGWAWFRQPDV